MKEKITKYNNNEYIWNVKKITWPSPITLLYYFSSEKYFILRRIKRARSILILLFITISFVIYEYIENIEMF